MSEIRTPQKAKLPSKAKSLLTKMTTGAVVLAGTVATTVHAALDQVAVDAIATEVVADAGIAAGAGFTVQATVLATSIGIGLIGRFVSKGAN